MMFHNSFQTAFVQLGTNYSALPDLKVLCGPFILRDFGIKNKNIFKVQRADYTSSALIISYNAIINLSKSFNLTVDFEEVKTAGICSGKKCS